MKNSNNRKKYTPIQFIRAAVQLIAFLLVPELFITVFSSIGSIYQSISAGTFQFGEQAGNIILAVTVFIITFVWGRVFCGFICSFGAMQDLLHLAGKHLPFRPSVPHRADSVMKFFKYIVLLLVVVFVWTFATVGNTVWSPWTVFGMYASPWKGRPSGTAFLSIGGLLLLLTIIGSLFIERFFCKYLCPLGALFAIASRFRIFKIKRNSQRCNGHCGLCTKKCSMSIPLYKYDRVNSGECINCMKCTEVCALGNIRADTAPAISGTLAAAALTGVVFAGTLSTDNSEVFTSADTANAVTATQDSGKFQDGTYTGTAMGYRGSISVTVEVSGGKITSIAVDSSNDDAKFLQQAQQQIIPDIIATQDTNVDTVSGATFSSRGIINAVSNALGTELITDSDDSETDDDTPSFFEEHSDSEETQDNTTEQSNNVPADGTYTGTGTGFRGTTEVSVTVEGGVITDITINSYQDDAQFFSRAENGVISEILSSQSIDVDTVSGATFSSNSIIEAVANALGQDFTNPNSSMTGRHGHHMR